MSEQKTQHSLDVIPTETCLIIAAHGEHISLFVVSIVLDAGAKISIRVFNITAGYDTVLAMSAVSTVLFVSDNLYH